MKYIIIITTIIIIISQLLDKKKKKISDMFPCSSMEDPIIRYIRGQHQT